MIKNLLRSFCIAGILSCLTACKEEPRNTAELVDPWLRERTPVDIRLEKQVGAATISSSWRHDERGSVSVQLVTGGLDLSRVKVESLEFQYPESEYCPTSSIKAGDVVDLSSGSATFTVTAYNGETRDYTITYSEFIDPIVGTYGHDLVAGILDGGAPKSSMLIIGGWPDAVVMSTAMDKSWHWGGGYTPADEEDNVVSFMLTEVDSETGETYGTVVNYAGEDGAYANYSYNNTYDVNEFYRIIPEGCSRWKKDVNGNLIIYAVDDASYENPLYMVNQLAAGSYTHEGKNFNIGNIAWTRTFSHADDEWVVDNNWPDTRWMVDNIRETIWTMVKLGDEPAPDHNEKFLAE